MLKEIKSEIKKLDYSLKDSELKAKSKSILEDIQKNNYNFSKFEKLVFTKNKKKRVIYRYNKLSTESIISHYLKTKIDNHFNIKYVSRGKVINSIFDILPLLKDLQDFVLIRVDFQDFFNSVKSRLIYDTYIKYSDLKRDDKNLLFEYSNTFKKCYAGLCLSNSFVEIVSNDFDKKMKSILEKNGLIFYERYVDDMFFLLNSFISEDDFLKILNDVIKVVFHECSLSINKSKSKYAYISKRNLQNNQHFSYLGYNFHIKYKDNKIQFEFGISPEKIKKFENKVEEMILDYKKDGNLEFLRQRIKFFNSRIVVGRDDGNKNYEWITTGIVANYNELKNHIDDLDVGTKKFLTSVYYDKFKELNVSLPYFIINSKDSIYCIKSTMTRNRSLIFEKKIGIGRKELVSWIRKIEPNYRESNKSYYQITMEYFMILKNE